MSERKVTRSELYKAYRVHVAYIHSNEITRRVKYLLHLIQITRANYSIKEARPLQNNK